MRYRSLVIVLIVIVVVVGGYLLIKANNKSSPPVSSYDNSQSLGVDQTPVNNNMQTQSPAVSSTVPTTAPPPSQASAVKTFNVSGTEFAFSPNTITVNKGDTVKINFTNNGTFPHNWTLDELSAKTATIDPGQSASVSFTASKSGTFQFYCSVPGHKDRGMVGSLTVR